METVIKLREEYIKLGQALKAAGLVDSGVDAKFVINDGLVNVNGQVELQRGKKLTAGDKVEYDGNVYYGFGANTDIVTASVEAYIDCINKFRK